MRQHKTLDKGIVMTFLEKLNLNVDKEAENQLRDRFSIKAQNTLTTKEIKEKKNIIGQIMLKMT